MQITTVRIPRCLHRWSVSPQQARLLQERLRERVVRAGAVRAPRLLAGADLAFSEDGSECVAGVVVWEVPTHSIVEQHVARRPVRFPYVPGLLTFREGPALLAALRKLRCEPDAFLFDGQGLAHPRRFGLASHMGVLLDRPSVGVAKSRLIGEHAEPGPLRGATTPLLHDGEVIGAVVRTRDRVKPIYVSIGHRVCLETAVELVLIAGAGCRVPEPTRLADQLVARARTA